MADFIENASLYPNIKLLTDSLLEDWPGHAKFVRRSLTSHTPDDLVSLEELASRIHLLSGDNLNSFISSYQWMCNVFNEEQFYFFRNSSYRHSNFSEVENSIYKDAEFMRKYMEGLLLSQLFWNNHAKSYIFHARMMASQSSAFRYLEVGPGHGLFLATAANHPCCVDAEAWDVSQESLSQTNSSLAAMGVTTPVKLVQRDVQSPGAPDGYGFDIIVMSEVVEHLEMPHDALRGLRSLLNPGGRILINIPINSPAPDHIFLLESPEQVVHFVEEAGFLPETVESFPATGYDLERAMASRATVSCAIIARAG